MANDTFEHLHNQWEDTYKNTPEFVAEEMAIDVTDEALTILSERGLTRSWLADAMGVSRQRVSAIFSATPNLTLLSIAQIVVALQIKPRLILDSERYSILPTDALSPDYEDRMTGIAYRQAQDGEPNPFDANIGSLSGESNNATT